MEGENINVPPAQEEEPEVFSVIIDGQLAQFNRRDFLGKTAVATAAVTLLTSGCTWGAKPVNIQATVDQAISATENAGKLTEIAAEGESGAAAEAAEPEYTDTPAPSDTPSPAPSDTPIPDTPTATATEKPAGIESAVKGDKVNFRSGPGTGYNPITMLKRGDPVLLVGRLEDNTWVAIALSDPSKPGATIKGWIKTSLVDTAGKDIQSLPVITDIPPTPTPLPGRFGFTTAGQKGLDYSYTDEYGNVYTMTLPCGAQLPAGSVCTCNCITVPRSCSCVDHTSKPCSCNTIHYWYPN